MWDFKKDIFKTDSGITATGGTIYQGANGGVIENSDNVYLTAHNAAAGTTNSIKPANGRIGQYLHLSSYIISRGYVNFDTTLITNTPTSATLYVYVTFTSTNGNLRIYKTSTSVISNANFGAVTFGSKYSDTPKTTLVTGYIGIPLNPTALTEMNTLTDFQIAILSETDSTVTAPVDDQGIDDCKIDFLTNVPYIQYT